MRNTPQFAISNLPEEGLRFFTSLMNWVEASRGSQAKTVSWRIGKNKLKILTCVKPKQGEKLTPPVNMSENTLYVPTNSSGRYVIRQIRHAYCHDDLIYDQKTRQYQINLTENVKIAGRFSLEAIIEFTNVFLSNTEQYNTNNKTK